MAMNKLPKLNLRDRAVLMKTPLISGLAPSVQARMLELAMPGTFAARGIIFREGTEAEHLYCILSGYVRLFRLGRDGREADIRICGPGDVFAECMLTMGPRHRYSAQAAENVTVARFDLQKMRMLVEREKEVARALMQVTANNLLSTMECVANDRLQTAPQRVAHYLLANCPPEGSEISIRLPFQKSLLAGKLGLAPEALSRAFSTLKPAGVTVRGRLIQIHDVSALKQI
ncbi:Crp/Fnr family transcriptional regulator [Rhizobiaceae bacterium n13]|uniref:Crp/Fnr family transcriptional regulator n=1 Tax=Ferirhizobium litorale TaxID=2927786 RepID=A0AAE3QCG0_9HYPH|nr:Crp/Fnr family transcriptional regulator [Fererhizobium litorale]MDI7860678.1 Crp/Fnr family transcriptional regulator [Fererhizobium litorale]MDI7920826.1 Crp/Fnr family transcriptional regulator [Fererhizobium litorale]